MTRIYGLLVLGGLLAGSASASPLYTNGPLDGTTNAYTVGFGDSVSNSFIIGSGATAYKIDFATWSFPGDVVTSVDWAIGTSIFGSEIASGTALPASLFQFTNGFGFDIYVNTVSLPAVPLAAGNYWLTLQSATSTSVNFAFWDKNNGPSTAYFNDGSGAVLLDGSEAFDIDTPEPGTIGLLGTGMLLLLASQRRRTRRS